MELFLNSNEIIWVSVLIGFTLLLAADDWRDNWNRTIRLQVIVLFIFNAKQGPLGTAEALCKSRNSEHRVNLIEEGIRAAQFVQEEYVDVA